MKNTYSKKSRPNNSKSVAVGSKSQGGNIKMRKAELVKDDQTLSIYKDK